MNLQWRKKSYTKGIVIWTVRIANYFCNVRDYGNDLSYYVAEIVNQNITPLYIELHFSGTIEQAKEECKQIVKARELEGKLKW